MFGLSNEDIDFLKELQHELKTQEHDCQASPRFWGVAETKREYGVDSDYGYDGCEVRIDFETYYDDVNDFREYLIENYSGECDETHELNQIDNLEEMYEYATEEYAIDTDEITLVYYRNLENVVSQETGCYLTKRACKRHIELNHYHYKNPHTYAMTAWRNPEFERLLNIIDKLDFESK